jgi:hypothetical protein
VVAGAAAATPPLMTSDDHISRWFLPLMIGLTGSMIGSLLHMFGKWWS